MGKMYGEEVFRVNVTKFLSYNLQSRVHETRLYGVKVLPRKEKSMQIFLVSFPVNTYVDDQPYAIKCGSYKTHRAGMLSSSRLPTAMFQEKNASADSFLVNPFWISSRGAMKTSELGKRSAVYHTMYSTAPVQLDCLQ